MSRIINLGRVTGKSAYEIWLDLGNIGTEQDFINSLEGQQGMPGKDGTNGVDGQDGYTPVKGVDYWTETEQNEIISTATTNVENNFASTIATIQSNSSNALNTANIANNTANTAKSIAEGANQALSYTNYQAMITVFNELADNVYKVGQNIMIITLNVPDLWISAIENTSITYTYTDDEAITTALATDGYIQVGYYKLSALETQKVDLTDYYTKTGTENKIEDYLYQIMPTDSTSGAIATINDATTMFNAIDVSGTIKPVQDLHGYDNPWPAGGGKNLLLATGTSEYFTLNDDGSYTLTAIPSSNKSYVIGQVDLKAGNSYILSGGFDTNFRLYTSYNRTSYTSATTDSPTIVCSSDTTVSIVTVITTSATIGSKIYPMVRLASNSSDYAPYSNICPISGWTGANVSATGINIWDEEWEIGGISSGKNISETDKIRSKNYIPVVSGNTYFFYCKTNNLIFLSYYDSDKNYLSYSSGIRNVAVTIPERCRYIRFRMQTTYGTTYNHDISINYPSTDYDYHPYTGRSITIDFPSEAGTVYGGTLDVTTGVLTVDRAMVDLGTLTWNRTTAYVTPVFYAIVAGKLKSNISMLCSVYKFSGNFGSAGGFANGSENASIGTCYANEQIFVRDDSYTDTAAFKSAMSGVQLVYKLDTPVTYQLTPQEVSFLLGTNNLWVDTGDINVTYKADIQKYIDKKTN